MNAGEVCARRGSNPHLPGSKSGPFVPTSVAGLQERSSNDIVPWKLPLSPRTIGAGFLVGSFPIKLLAQTPEGRDRSI